jgi:hypothetical protein
LENGESASSSVNDQPRRTLDGVRPCGRQCRTTSHTRVCVRVRVRSCESSKGNVARRSRGHIAGEAAQGTRGHPSTLWA